MQLVELLAKSLLSIQRFRRETFSPGGDHGAHFAMKSTLSESRLVGLFSLSTRLLGIKQLDAVYGRGNYRAMQ